MEFYPSKLRLSSYIWSSLGSASRLLYKKQAKRGVRVCMSSLGQGVTKKKIRHQP